jgi:hypothetical protein
MAAARSAKRVRRRRRPSLSDRRDRLLAASAVRAQQTLEDFFVFVANDRVADVKALLARGSIRTASTRTAIRRSSSRRARRAPRRSTSSSRRRST